LNRTAPSAWISRPASGPEARLRLLCFPYAGGTAASFHGWSARLPLGIELCAIQLPGHGNRLLEPRFSRLGPLVDALELALEPTLEAPYACFGHSLGALVAFELARRCERHGRRGPVQLYVSGHRAPHLPARHRAIHALQEEELLYELSRLDGGADEALGDAELRSLALPILRDDFAIAETYTHVRGEPLEAPIFALGGTHDPIVEEGELLAWREHTRDSFRSELVPGGHFFVETARDAVLGLLAEDLWRCLRSA
jgi:medium-chain acyl-[acyl-carrier-protein] hydrolase